MKSYIFQQYYLLKIWRGSQNEINSYIRIAPEVFMRIVANQKASEKHYRRIEQFAPKTGTVRLLRLTKKNIKIFIWCPAKLIIKKKQLVATVILCYNLI